MYLSVCSGIEAATCKLCTACGETKVLSEFHKQPTGKLGRHSYCKACYNARYKNRERSDTPAQKRGWNLKRRYGLSALEFDRILEQQGGVCAICGESARRLVVDHCHRTGRLRELLCHRCNVMIGGFDDLSLRAAAIAYLEKHQ